MKGKNKMNPNKLDYFKIVRDIGDMLEDSFFSDMDLKLFGCGEDGNDFTQKDAQIG